MGKERRDNVDAICFIDSIVVEKLPLEKTFKSNSRPVCSVEPQMANVLPAKYGRKSSNIY